MAYPIFLLFFQIFLVLTTNCDLVDCPECDKLSAYEEITPNVKHKLNLTISRCLYFEMTAQSNFVFSFILQLRPELLQYFEPLENNDDLIYVAQFQALYKLVNEDLMV